MKNSHILPGIVAVALMTNACKSGLVTMSNSCYDLIAAGQSQNKAGNYNAALDNFNQVLKKCDAYDAKEKGYAGKAAALNGAHQYNDALSAAIAGLKINTSSLDNLFEKATAEQGLGMESEARTDLQTIIGLTEKNRNTAQRATIYAKIAETEMHQQQYNDALGHISQAISLDNSNLSFYMQRGDIYTTAGNLPAALGAYDEAISKGKNDAEAWKSKTTTLIRIYQEKYDTRDAGTLKRKISTADKQTLCTSITNGQNKGMRDATIDLLQSTICQ